MNNLKIPDEVLHLIKNHQSEMPELIRELMEQYNKNYNKWVEKFKTDNGFDNWFTQQVEKGKFHPTNQLFNDRVVN